MLESESLVADVVPPALKQQIEDGLGVAKGWKSGPEKILTVMIEAAKT